MKFSNDQRRKGIYDYVLPLATVIMGVVLSLVGSAVVSAIHDLTVQVSILSSKVAVIETYQLANKEHFDRVNDELAAQKQEQNAIRDIIETNYATRTRKRVAHDQP
jgi:Na+/phosphate symporter